MAANGLRNVKIVKVKCMTCGRDFTNLEVGEHKRNTGHNCWELVIPNGRYYGEKIRNMMRQ